jgi:hypothetical protein
MAKTISNNKTGHAEIHEQCEICGDVKNINNHNLCPFCQLDIDLN